MKSNQEQPLPQNGSEEIPSRHARVQQTKNSRKWFKRKNKSKVSEGTKVPSEEQLLEPTVQQSVQQAELQPAQQSIQQAVQQSIQQLTAEAAPTIEELREGSPKPVAATTPLAPHYDERAFFEALQAVQEQAGALAVAQPPLRLPERSGLTRLQGWLLAGLAFSVVANLGSAYLVYKYRHLVQAQSATLAQQDQNATAGVQPVPDLQPDQVPAIKQEVAWTQAQLDILPREERTRLEGLLSAVKKPDDFKNGSFNFLFVAGVNEFQLTQGGGVLISSFVSNGYRKGYTPKMIKVTVYEGNQVVLAGTSQDKSTPWAPNDIYLTQYAFTANDIRDPQALDRLAKNPAQQSKLRFEARITFDQDKPGGEKEELWELMNTHTEVPVTKK